MVLAGWDRRMKALRSVRSWLVLVAVGAWQFMEEKTPITSYIHALKSSIWRGLNAFFFSVGHTKKKKKREKKRWVWVPLSERERETRKHGSSAQGHVYHVLSFPGAVWLSYWVLDKVSGP